MSKMILRIDGDHASVVAESQREPDDLVATAALVAWAIADDDGPARHIVSVAAKGGTPNAVLDLPAGTLVGAMTATARGFAYAQTASSDKAPASAIFAIAAAGGTPSRIATARATCMTSDGATIYWIEDAPGAGHQVRAAPAP